MPTQPLPANFAVAPQAPAPSDSMRRKREPLPKSMPGPITEETSRPSGLSESVPAEYMDFSDLGGAQHGIDFSDLGGQYHVHESQLTPESERPISFVASDGRKYQASADAWEKVQKADPGAKQT
jgi:hypothetical protein